MIEGIIVAGVVGEYVPIVAGVVGVYAPTVINWAAQQAVKYALSEGSKYLISFTLDTVIHHCRGR